MKTPAPNAARRHLVLAGAATLAGVAAPALASSRRSIATMTDGPFYPPRAWREQWTDWDADLSRVQRGGRVLEAQGETLGLELRLIDVNGRIVDGAEIEIWQCDALAAYRHPRVQRVAGSYDEGFQGFGASRSGADGQARFRSIRPVPYPGRTPHIHIKLRHASFGELTSQLFIAGDPGNARDFLWQRLGTEDRAALTVAFEPGAEAYRARFPIVVAA